jgi:hypothetical protein
MSASDIRQAVIEISKESCGMVAVRAQTIWGANLIPLGAACGGGDDPRRKPARSRAPAKAYGERARTTARPRRPGDGRWEMRRRAGQPPSDWGISERSFQRKSPRRISPCGPYDFCDDDIMPVICPTCQTILTVTELHKMQRNSFDELKLIWVIIPKGKPATGCRRGLYDIGDGANVPLICPTRQALTQSDGVRRHRNRSMDVGS